MKKKEERKEGKEGRKEGKRSKKEKKQRPKERNINTPSGEFNAQRRSNPSDGLLVGYS